MSLSVHSLSMCSAVLSPTTETAEKVKTFVFLPGKEDAQSFTHKWDKAHLNVMSFIMGSRFSLDREMSVISCCWHSEISVGTRRKWYGSVWNSSTALGNQAQKLTVYLKMHGFSVACCFKQTGSHLERAERIQYKVFLITREFHIHFQWKMCKFNKDGMFVYICLLCCKITTQLWFHDLKHHLQVMDRNASFVQSRRNYKIRAKWKISLAFWG